MNDVAENKRIALALIESMDKGLDFSLMADEFEWWSPAIGVLNRAQMEEVAAKFGALVKSPPAMTVSAATAEENRVAIEAKGHAVLKDGRIYANTYHFLIYLRDGKITHVREHCDTAYAASLLSNIAG
jgi:ketosteroid isomerase-like protein